MFGIKNTRNLRQAFTPALFLCKIVSEAYTYLFSRKRALLALKKHGGIFMRTGKLMLIDGNSIINRAFYGLQGPQLLSTSEGVYTNAVYGFLNIMFKYIEEENPDYLCVAFDLKAPTYRQLEYKEYKAHRKGMPDELAAQVPILKDVLDAMNIRRLEYEGYEADDIIGSISLCAENEGMDVVILTGDRDSLQLVSNKTRVKLPTTRKGKNETIEYDYESIVNEYGIVPEQFIDLKGLMGDPSDNIPGVKGIGEKTALALIKEYGSVEGVYENLENIKGKSIREKLAENREMALLSKKLAAINRQMPWMCSIDDLKRHDFDRPRLYQLFKKLEFNSFIQKLNLTAEDKDPDNAVNVWVIENTGELKKLREQIYDKKEFALFHHLDAESESGLTLIGLSVCLEKDKAAYIRISGGLKEEDFIPEFRDVFEDDSVKKYGHDVKSLYKYFKTKGIRIKGVSFDTMLAGYIINPSKPAYTVSELAAEYLGIRIKPIEELLGKGKNSRTYGELPFEELSRVSAGHVAAIFGMRGELERIIAENGQEELYYNIELPLVEVLADMEFWGFKVNIEALEKLSAEFEEKIEQAEKEIYDLAGEKFNINSPKQLGAILFEKLGLPVLKKTKTGYSTDAEVLEQLEDRHEIIRKILQYRQMIKLKSTYIQGLINVADPSTGRVHSNFNQTVTSTGRISSTEPNLQNIPVKLEAGREIRKVFVPENDDFVLVDADYSQIELRILAHISEDENMISAFRNNEDIHSNTASRVFGVPKEMVTPLMRARAKAVNFGIVYGIGDFSLSRDLGITRREAKQYIEEYLAKYPGVKKYMHEIVEEGKKNGYVTTMFNRRRYLPELKSSNHNIRSFGERIALNTPIQGSAADIIKIAMVKVYNELLRRGMKSRLILQVHDELIIEAAVEEQDQVFAILKECMEKAVNMKVPLKVDVKSGRSWYETK